MKRFVSIVIFLSGPFLASAAPTISADPPVRIKNFREILASYETILTNGQATQDLLDVYNLVKDRLPRYGLPQELNSPVVLAMTELSGAFCVQAIAREKALSFGERTLFSNVDFTRGPIQFTDYLNGLLSEQFATLFWQREVKSTEKEVITGMIREASKTNPNTASETDKVLQLICTTYGSSLAFLNK